MVDNVRDNQFLNQLLGLQQDGNQAISAPSNWLTPPLLEVETSLDREVDQLCSSLRGGNGENKETIWYFLVGSPGNGKSAQVGRMVRELLKEGFEFEPDIRNLDPGDIPYCVKVRPKGTKYSTVWFTQDASVVPNPFSSNPDPAQELIRLMEDATQHGVGLVVCANRGVLERAFQLTYTDKSKNQTSWFKALRVIEEGKEENKPLRFDRFRRKQAFESFTVKAGVLDMGSLIFDSSVIADLVSKATSAENWATCVECSEKQFCPFLANRDWLQSKTGQGNFLKLLGNAELYDGQNIVLREANALLSFILAGCPKDYSQLSPCAWVRSRTAEKNYFDLVARRIYVSLFQSMSPLGFEPHKETGELQREIIGNIVDGSKKVPTGVRTTVQRAVSGPDRLSTDVGLPRLLGQDGVLAELDPINGELDQAFLDTWDDSADVLLESTIFQSQHLERKCLEIWGLLEGEIGESSFESLQQYCFLRRWITAFVFRFGCLLEGKFIFGEELGEMQELQTGRGQQGSRRALELTRNLERDIGTLLGIDEGIEISRFVQISGPWVARTLNPRIKPDEAIGAGGLQIEIGHHQLLLSVREYVWLRRRHRLKMSEKTFPMDLLDAAKDLRVRVAAQGNYAFEEDGVCLNVARPDRKLGDRLERYRGSILSDSSEEIET